MKDTALDSDQAPISAKSILPPAFWFRFAVDCPRIDDFPREKAGGPLLDLPESHALPDLKQLEGGTSWAQVRVAWNPKGLGFAILADGVSPEQCDPERPEGFAKVTLWVDTRDTRTVARATRFCHRFVFELKVGKARNELKVEASQKPVARANVESPICNPEIIGTRAELHAGSWKLEVFLPAEAMKGFDEETNRRLGFAYQIVDFIHEDQYFSVGGDFPIGENPSLWSTLVLHG